MNIRLFTVSSIHNVANENNTMLFFSLTASLKVIYNSENILLIKILRKHLTADNYRVNTKPGLRLFLKSDQWS